MANPVNVSIWIPGSNVASMQDEIADGKVQAAVDAALKAYKPIDSDGDVPVKTYTEDFDNAVEESLAYAGTTPGADLVVIISDLESNDRAKAERLLAQVKANGDMVVVVPVSNQGYDEDWATKLDADTPAGSNHVDFVTVEELADPAVALAEVKQFLATV